MKKILLISLLIYCFSDYSFSQIYVDNQGNVIDQRKKTTYNEKPVNRNEYKPKNNNKFDASKLVFGGDLGLQFGDYTVVNISPQVGYAFSKYVTLGAGIGYSYYKDSYYIDRDKYKYTRNYAGFNVYGRFYPIQYIVLSVQPEINRMWSTIKNNTSGEKYSENKFIPSVVLGGGFRLGPVLMMIQYDVVQDNYSPYGDNLFYTIGYTFGF